ncbi:MAG: NAD(P)-binding domain-containing protein [Saprospiraceae bacterium]|nr:NAD(P)-binding domain-containing protein [Saprospiraceae bacterium]
MDILITDLFIEKLIIYGSVFGLCILVVSIYLLKQKKTTARYKAKIAKAKEEGIFEPVSLHPVIDTTTCIKSGACIEACPEKDILGIVNGRATLVNASNCVGHGACFHACPVEAITLVIGTEKRGVDLPHVHQTYETNVPGIYIAGELGGMGLIKNSVEQGTSAIENMLKEGFVKEKADWDVVIIGAGPAGIAASLTAKKHKLNFITLEQDSLGGTVFTFPRAKVVMTNPMDLPLHGKVMLKDTNKKQLLDLWTNVLTKNDIHIKEFTKVESISNEGKEFKVLTAKGDVYYTSKVLIAIGRRGTPRRLNVPGEDLEKVAYRLLEPENISGKKVLVVGGGDSAIESALLLAEQNKVTLSYRSEQFSRLKPKNAEKIKAAMTTQVIEVLLNTQVSQISEREVQLKQSNTEELLHIPNDLVYIFAGGELPTQFLEKAGIQISKRFGYTMKKHS